MSNIRPQQEPPSTQQQQQQPPLPPGTVSVDKIWNLGITFLLLILIILVGFFMIKGFWRYAMYKVDAWLMNRRGETQKKRAAVPVQQQQQEEDDEEEEEEEEPVVVVRKKGNARRR